MTPLTLPAPGTTRYGDHPLSDEGAHRYTFACEHGETHRDELRPHDRPAALRGLVAEHDRGCRCDCATRRLLAD